MAEVCHSFARNAWKKDLCSNCMKSINEHEKVTFTETVADKIETNNNSVVFNVRSMTTVFNSRNIENRNEDPKRHIFLRNSPNSERREIINVSSSNSRKFHIQPNNGHNRDSLNGLVGNTVPNGNNVMIIQNENDIDNKPLTTTRIIIGSSITGNSNMTVIQSGNYTQNSSDWESDEVPEMGMILRRDSKNLPDLTIRPTSSILKTNLLGNFDKKKRKISIELDKIEIIGYGGDSSGPPPEENQDPPDPEELPNTEEEKEIAKITSNNTAWNCNKTNLLLQKALSKQMSQTAHEQLLHDENKVTILHTSQLQSLKSPDSAYKSYSSSKIKNLYSTVPPRRKSPPPRASVKPFFREVPMSNSEQGLKVNAVSPMRRKSEEIPSITDNDFSDHAHFNQNFLSNTSLKNESPPLKTKDSVNRTLSSEFKEQINLINNNIQAIQNMPDMKSKNSLARPYKVVEMETKQSVPYNVNNIPDKSSPDHPISKDNHRRSSSTNSDTSSNLSYAISPVGSSEPKSPTTCTFQATLSQNTPFRTFGKGEEPQPKISPSTPVNLSPPATTGNGDVVPIIVNTLDRKKTNSRNSTNGILQNPDNGASTNGTSYQSSGHKEPPRATINKPHDSHIYDPVYNGRPVSKEVKVPEVPVYAEPSHDGSESYKSSNYQRENSDSKSDTDIRGICTHPDPKNKAKRPAPAPPTNSDSEIASNVSDSKAQTLPVSPSSVQSASSDDLGGKSSTFSGHSKKPMSPTEKSPSGNDTISKKKNRFSLKRLLKFGSKDQENIEGTSNVSNSPDDAHKFFHFSKSHKKEDNLGLRKEDISPPIMLEQAPVQDRVAEWCARIPSNTEMGKSPEQKDKPSKTTDNQMSPPIQSPSELTTQDGQQAPQKREKVKPAPPPRTKTLSNSSLKKSEIEKAKMAVVTSVRNESTEETLKAWPTLATSSKTLITDYANLVTIKPNENNVEGDIRSSLAPKKPDRGNTTTSEDEEVEVQKRKAPVPPIRADKNRQSLPESTNILQYSQDKITNVLSRVKPLESSRTTSSSSGSLETNEKLHHVTCIRIDDSGPQDTPVEQVRNEDNSSEKVNLPYSKYKVIELPQTNPPGIPHKNKAPPLPAKEPKIHHKGIEMFTPRTIIAKESPHEEIVKKQAVQIKAFSEPEIEPTILNGQVPATNIVNSKSVEAKFRVIVPITKTTAVEKELLEPFKIISTIQTSNKNDKHFGGLALNKEGNVATLTVSPDNKEVKEHNVPTVSISPDSKEVKEHKLKRSSKIFSRNNEVTIERGPKVSDSIHEVIESLTDVTLKVVAINKIEDENIVSTSEDISPKELPNKVSVPILHVKHEPSEKEISPNPKVLENGQEEFSNIVITFNKNEDIGPKICQSIISSSVTAKEIWEFKESDNKILKRVAANSIQNCHETKTNSPQAADPYDPTIETKSSQLGRNFTANPNPLLVEHSVSQNDKPTAIVKSLVPNIEQLAAEIESHTKSSTLCELQQSPTESQLFKKESPVTKLEFSQRNSDGLLESKTDATVIKSIDNEPQKIVLPVTKETSPYKVIDLPHLKMKDLNAKVTVSSLQKMFEPSHCRKITPSHPINLANSPESSNSTSQVVIVESSMSKPENLYKTKVSALQKMFERNQCKIESYSIASSNTPENVSLQTEITGPKASTPMDIQPLTQTSEFNEITFISPTAATQQKIIEFSPPKTIITSEPVVTVRSYTDVLEHALVKESTPVINCPPLHLLAASPSKLHSGVVRHVPSPLEIATINKDASFSPTSTSPTKCMNNEPLLFRKPQILQFKEPALATQMLHSPSKVETSHFKVTEKPKLSESSSAEHSAVNNGVKRKSGGFEELKSRPSRPVLRRSRGSFRLVFNKSLEENYSSITNANLESLAQMMDFLAKDFTGESMTRTNYDNLKWQDFKLVSSSPQMKTPYGIFYEAKWKYDEHQLYTIMVSKGRGLIGARPQYLHSLRSSAQFNDQIPAFLLNPHSSEGDSNIMRPATIEVLAHCSLQNLPSFVQSNMAARRNHLEAYEKEVCFLLLQVVSGLKFLQAQGVEELTNTLDHFILIKNDNETFNRFVILNGEISNINPGAKLTIPRTPKLSLCHCVLKLMKLFIDGEETSNNFVLTDESLFSDKLSHVAAILKLEKADSLTWAMSAFEYMLWGPSTPPWNEASESDNLEQVAQMWLDLERARVVNSILRHSISGEVELRDIEEYQIPFLVRSTPQKLLDVHHIISERIIV